MTPGNGDTHIDAQFERVFKELKEQRDQLREDTADLRRGLDGMKSHIDSVARSVASNSSDDRQRLTALESDLRGNVERDELLWSQSAERHQGLDRKVSELAVEVGREVGKLEADFKNEMEDLRRDVTGIREVYQQAKGMRTLGAWVVALATVVSIGFNIFHYLAGH